MTTGNSAAVQSFGTGTLTVEAELIESDSATTETLASANSSTLKIKGAQIKNINAAGECLDASVGTMILENCRIEGTDVAQVARVNTGRLELINSRLENKSAGASAHGILITDAATVILNQSRIVLGNTAAFDVSAPSNRNIKVMNSYTNSAVKDAQITEQIDAMKRDANVE